MLVYAEAYFYNHTKLAFAHRLSGLTALSLHNTSILLTTGSGFHDTHFIKTFEGPNGPRALLLVSPLNVTRAILAPKTPGPPLLVHVFHGDTFEKHRSRREIEGIAQRVHQHKTAILCTELLMSTAAALLPHGCLNVS